MKKIVSLVLVMGFVLGTVLWTQNKEFKTVSWTTKIEKFVKHTVTSGDTLDQIAKLYGTTKLKILKRNEELSDMQLKVGQKIVIPVSGYQEKLIL